MRELTGGEAEAQAGAGGGEGPGQAVAAAQVGVEVEAGGVEVGAKGGGGGREAGALTLQQLRSRKSSKRTGPIGDGQKSTTFLCQRWALLPQGRLFEKSTFLSFAKGREDRRQREKREREQMYLIQMTLPQTILDLCEEEECRICGVRLLHLENKK